MNKIEQKVLVNIIEESLQALDAQTKEQESKCKNTTDRMVKQSFQVGWLRSLIDQEILPVLKDKA